MNIIEVYLFELALKGDRLDEINAEEVLNRRAAAQAKANARRRYLRRLRQQWVAWVTRRPQMTAAPSDVAAK